MNLSESSIEPRLRALVKALYAYEACYMDLLIQYGKSLNLATLGKNLNELGDARKVDRLNNAVIQARKLAQASLDEVSKLRSVVQELIKEGGEIVD